MLFALLFGYLLVLIAGNGLGIVPGIDFTAVKNAAWFGLPHFTTPAFNWQAVTLIAPVAIVLVAENLGHIKALGSITGRNMDGYIGRGLLQRWPCHHDFRRRRRHRASPSMRKISASWP